MSEDAPKDSGAEMFALLVLVIPLMLWSGFVLSKLWLWFLVPLGVPAISIAHAIGIDAVAQCFKSWGGSKQAKSSSEIISLGIAKPGFLLLVGWVALQWMPV